MTKQGAIKACMTSPDVCVADVNNFSIMEKERWKGGNCSVQSYQRKCQIRVSNVNKCEREAEGIKSRESIIVCQIYTFHSCGAKEVKSKHSIEKNETFIHDFMLVYLHLS